MSILKKDVPVGLCCDHAGFPLKEIVRGYLESNDIPYKDFGTFSSDSCDYPDYAHPCALAVESGEVYPAIAICSTGNGIAMTLNKHQGVRAALCWAPELAHYARAHNDANVLVMPRNYIEPALAMECVDVFFATDFEGGRHGRRVSKIPVSSCKCD